MVFRFENLMTEVDFGPKSDDLGRWILKSVFFRSNFAHLDCTSKCFHFLGLENMNLKLEIGPHMKHPQNMS